MEQQYCQSCGMPMNEDDGLYGTNTDGSQNMDYCKYCFENGAFTSNTTLDEMIEICVPYMTSVNSGMNEEDARNTMRAFLPGLKRWRQA